ncbi:MAG: coenzyme F420-0:L-glutamate ligase [Candidatus Helarchaeota archaeon]
MTPITLIPIKTRLITPNDDIFQVIVEELNNSKLKLQDGDVLVLAQSALSSSQGRLVDLNSIIPSKKALALAKKYEMDQRFVQVILDHSDRVIGGMKRVLLCEIDDVLIANAGIDLSNAPPNHAILFPEYSAINEIRMKLETHFGVWIGLIISDSKTQPLRRGVVGMALATSGFEPVEDERGKSDLFGRKLEFTFRAIADDLATAAQLLMGEANESIPLVLIRGVPITRAEKARFDPRMPYDKCLYMNALKESIDNSRK